MKVEVTSGSPTIIQTENIKKEVKVKFNFPLMSSNYDSSIAVKKAKEEKSHIAFEQQLHMDLKTVSNFYEAGKIYAVSEEFYNKFKGRTVETYSKFFGKIENQTKKLAKRPKLPYMLKVDENGNLLDPMEHTLDLYAINED